jgi:hypothetical protein
MTTYIRRTYWLLLVALLSASCTNRNSKAQASSIDRRKTDIHLTDSQSQDSSVIDKTIADRLNQDNSWKSDMHIKPDLFSKAEAFVATLSLSA